MQPRPEIEIHLNGSPRAIPAGTSVEALLATLGLRPEVVAIEVNERLVRRELRATETLAAGDRIEVVTLVGGG